LDFIFGIAVSYVVSPAGAGSAAFSLSASGAGSAAASLSG
jgi:hypothetical protein